MAQQLLQTENYWQQKLFMFHLIMTHPFSTISMDETIFKASIADGNPEIWKILIKRILLW
jgi:hypothetical protein